MPECPNCHKEIDSLIEEETKTTTATVMLSPSEQTLTYEDESCIDRDIGYSCPECAHKLQLHSYEQAKSFLRGELS